MPEVDLVSGRAQVLRFHISCDMTPQQVHDLGLEEVKRIRTRMQQVRDAHTCPQRAPRDHNAWRA